MTPFVLIPGFWLGAWAWKDVAEALRAAGHTVYPLTLTGLAERAGEGGPQVTLDTQVADVVDLLRAEDLRGVVLVGHSFGANVISGAADHVPERIARLVYVDSWPLPEGISQADLNSPEGQEAQARQVAEHGDGWRLPMPPWEELDQGNELAGLGEAERRLMRDRATGQPYGAITQPVRPRNPARMALPKTVILCSMTAAEAQELVEAYPRVTSTLAEPGWQVLELPTGHWPMFSKPKELAEMLAGLA
jgi:pimeloyl-ACP methyl ester carboxylesterase